MKGSSMVAKKTWNQFRETGLLCLLNSFLHIFGWAIVIVMKDDGKVTECFPARVKFRGFDDKSQTKAYINVSKYMLKNSKTLLKEAQE